MPCNKASSITPLITGMPSDVTTTGRTSYTTEADCLNACKEGACCEGTTCTVKPQCQCQCTTGRCCGPDLVEVRTGEFYSAWRAETKAACLARGGSWKCGSFGPQSIEGVLPSAVGKPVCPVNAGTPEPVFKGVGTTCASSPCCSCESLVSVTIKLPQVLGGSQITRAGCNGTIMADSSLLYWTCTSSGFTISLSNSYQTKSDGICQHPAYFASRSYTVDVAATSQSGPCASVVISGCAAASFLAARTLTKGDFTALPEGQAQFNNSLPLSCWTFGSPSSEVLFPEWVKIGPATNPLP
jgi:hypothetical protein